MITIATKPDMSIEPGHQWLMIWNNLEGYALAYAIAGQAQIRKEGQFLLVAHTQAVDETIMDLINQLAHVRFSAPNLVQITLLEVPVQQDTAVDDGGLEGA
jgi:hypothetical protein